MCTFYQYSPPLSWVRKDWMEKELWIAFFSLFPRTQHFLPKWWARKVIGVRKNIIGFLGHSYLTEHHCSLWFWSKFWLRKHGLWGLSPPHSVMDVTHLPCNNITSYWAPTHVGPSEVCTCGTSQAQHEKGATKRRGHIYWVHFLC